jgi:hypothetical protein
MQVGDAACFGEENNRTVDEGPLVTETRLQAMVRRRCLRPLAQQTHTRVLDGAQQRCPVYGRRKLPEPGQAVLFGRGAWLRDTGSGTPGDTATAYNASPKTTRRRPTAARCSTLPAHAEFCHIGSRIQVWTLPKPLTKTWFRPREYLYRCSTVQLGPCFRYLYDDRMIHLCSIRAMNSVICGFVL